MGILKMLQDSVTSAKKERKQQEDENAMEERIAHEEQRRKDDKLLNLDYKSVTPKEVAQLLEIGADIDDMKKRRREGIWTEETPVALALEAFNYPVFEMLVNRGANLSVLMGHPNEDDPPYGFYILQWAQYHGLVGDIGLDNWTPPRKSQQTKENADFREWFKRNYVFLKKLGIAREAAMSDSYTVTQRNFLDEPMSYTYAARGNFFPKRGVQGYVLPDGTVIDMSMSDSQLQKINPYPIGSRARTLWSQEHNNGKNGKGKHPLTPPINGGSVYGG